MYEKRDVVGTMLRHDMGGRRPSPRFTAQWIKALCSTLIIAAIIACLPARAALAATSFKDVNSKSSHREDIVWLAENKISEGFPDGTFRPYDTVKRCDMAAFLYRMAGSPAYTPSAAEKAYFSDVNSRTPHAKEIWWLAAQGISKGWDISGGRHEFRPYDTVKRCDMAAFLYRLAGEPEFASWDGLRASFLDTTKKTPHCEEVWWLAFTGISQGWMEPSGVRTFRPYDNVARCDMAAFLHRMAEAGLVGGGSRTGSGATTTPAKRTCTACGGTGTVKTGSRTVTDQAAWDEVVVDSAAWDEWVVDQEEWTEEVYLGVMFSTGVLFGPGEDAAQREYAKSLMLSGTDYSYWNEYDYILHEEEGHYEHHEAVTHVEHHEAVTHAEDVYGTCTACGGTGKV